MPRRLIAEQQSHSLTSSLGRDTDLFMLHFRRASRKQRNSAIQASSSLG
jgi:hypothetical protein